MVKKTELIEKASKGYIKDWYNAQKLLISKNQANGVLPDFDRETALKAIRTDYAVQTALNILVDKSLENGHNFFGEDDKSNLDEFKKTWKKIRGERQLRQWFYQIYGYLNCFIEIVKDGADKVKELHTLETTQTAPVIDKHGTVVGYVQNVSDSKDDSPSWTPEEVTHIKVNTLTNSGWSDIDIKSLYTSVLVKEYIMEYLGWKTGTNQLRPILNFKNANDDDVKEFLSYWKAAQENIELPLPMKGEVEALFLNNFDEGDTLLKMLDKMDENIYSVMHVPPIASNETGQSNRSSADKQEQMLAMRVKAIHQVFTEAFENDLAPKMGFNKISIKFNSPINTDFAKIVDVAEQMKNLGIKIELIERYMIESGFYKEKELFDKEKLELQKQGMMPQNKSEHLMDSRKRKPKDETSKNIGTGEESTTREDQLVQKAASRLTYDLTQDKMDKFSDYPYNY